MRRLLLMGATLLLLRSPSLPAQAAPLAAAAAPALALSASQAVLLADADVQTVGAGYRPYVLYLYVPPHVEEKDLDLLWRVLSGIVNGMSREAQLVPLWIVPGSGNRLYRASLKDYRWSAKTVNQFALVDTYFYEIVPEYWAGGDGYAAGTYLVPALAAYVAEGPVKAPFLSLVAAMQRPGVKRTVPIVSVTSFVFQTFISTNGSPKYNDFLEIKTESDFFKVIGVRADEDETFEKNLLAVIAKSGITYKPRAVEKRNKIGGELWRTHDFAKAVKGSNPFENLGRDAKKNLRAKADAHEDFGHLANGMFGVGLFNGAGVAQDNAPDTITTGDVTTTDSTDHRVHMPLGCFRCHVQAGLQDLNDWVRNLQEPPPFPPLALQVGNKTNPKDLAPAVDEALRFRRQYGLSLLPDLARGRSRFAEAVLEVTGLKPAAYSAGLGEVWHLVAEPEIDSDWAARDLGVTEQVFVDCLHREIKTEGGTDVLLSGFKKPKAKQQPIALEQWLEIRPRAQRLLRGLATVDIPKGKP